MSLFRPQQQQMENLSQFDRETAVKRIDNDTGKDDATFLFSTNITNNWNTGTHPNGGYLAAIILRAMQQSLPQPHPLASSVFFLTPAIVGPGIVKVTRLRDSKRLSIAQGVLIQQDPKNEKKEIEILRVTATWSDLESLKSTSSSTNATDLIKPPEDLPPMDSCIRATNGHQFRWRPFTLIESIHIYYDPSASPLTVGKATHGKMNAWIIPQDKRDPDIIFLALACDSLFPAVANLGATFSWVPTLELTTHYRQLPKPGPLKVFTRASNLLGGLVEVNALVFDSEDRFVASARQIGMLLPPPPRNTNKQQKAAL